MININKEILCNNFNQIACEVFFDKIILNFDVKTLVSYARISQQNYKELIENFRGLWDRNVRFSSGEIAQNPLLPLLTVINGLQRFYRVVTATELQKLSTVSSLYGKHKKLFVYDWSFKALPELSKYRSLTVEACEKGLVKWDRCGGVLQEIKLQVNDKRYDLNNFQHEIFRSRALIILNFLAGFLDAKPFVFLLTLRWLKGINGWLISLPFWMSLFYWVHTTNGDIYTARNFLNKNINLGFTNNEMLERSFRAGFGIVILAILLLMFFRV